MLNIVDDILSSGVSPLEICFVAFTRKAANEARERAVARFKIPDSEFVYFRTLHSLAFMQLNLSKNTVMGVRDYITLAGMLGISITAANFSEDGTTYGMTRGDRMLFLENLARVNDADLEETWRKFDNDIGWYELLRVRETLDSYKKSYGKVDFTDMITKFNTLHPVPETIRYLIVDEVQDLSKIQWVMVDILSEHVEQTYVAGDDDQAIFRWAGADVEHFIDLDGDRTVMQQSYRVPVKVHETAMRIISTIKHRIDKEWKPRSVQGTVEYHEDIGEIDMSSGTWMLLARNSYMLNQYEEYCISSGYSFDSVLNSLIRGDSFRAIRAWESLRRGQRIPITQAREIYDYMSVRQSVKYGFKRSLEAAEEEETVCIDDLKERYGLVTNEPWNIALDRLNDVEREYFLTALRAGEKLLKEPRIKINTIHGVKGGEAQHVVISLDMAKRTFEEYQNNRDDECRVWYVAVTRASESLHVLLPTTSLAFEDLMI